jgi:hypothetical protein
LGQPGIVLSGNGQPGIHGRLDAAYHDPGLNFTANPGVYQVIVGMQPDGTLQ